MPTYTYKCEECEHEFDTTQSMKDDKLTDCPECKEPKLMRLITKSGGFRIGGRGVYKPTSHWGS